MKLQVVYTPQGKDSSPVVEQVEQKETIYPPGLYALVQEDTVVEVSEDPHDVAGMKWVLCPHKNVKHGWKYINDELISPKEDQKLEIIDFVKERCFSKLVKTDWMVVRQMETGKPIADEWKEYRQKLRDLPDEFVDYETTPFPKMPDELSATW